MKALLVFGSVLLIQTASPAWAELPTHPIEAERVSSHYPTQSAAQLLCGASNAAFGWTELIWYTARNSETPGGSVTAFFRLVGRTAISSSEMATLLVPGLDSKVNSLEPRCAVSIVDLHQPSQLESRN